MELFIYLFAALFSVLNPIGTVPIFVGLTQFDDKKERSRISLWTAIDVFIILLIAFFVGQYVLTFSASPSTHCAFQAELSLLVQDFRCSTEGLIKIRASIKKLKPKFNNATISPLRRWQCLCLLAQVRCRF